LSEDENKYIDRNIKFDPSHDLSSGLYNISIWLW